MRDFTGIPLAGGGGSGPRIILGPLALSGRYSWSYRDESVNNKTNLSDNKYLFLYVIKPWNTRNLAF